MSRTDILIMVFALIFFALGELSCWADQDKEKKNNENNNN